MPSQDQPVSPLTPAEALTAFVKFLHMRPQPIAFSVNANPAISEALVHAFIVENRIPNTYRPDWEKDVRYPKPPSDSSQGQLDRIAR